MSEEQVISEQLTEEQLIQIDNKIIVQNEETNTNLVTGLLIGAGGFIFGVGSIITAAILAKNDKTKVTIIKDKN